MLTIAINAIEISARFHATEAVATQPNIIEKIPSNLRVFESFGLSLINVMFGSDNPKFPIIAENAKAVTEIVMK